MRDKYVILKLLPTSTATNENTDNIASKVNVLNKHMKITFSKKFRETLEDSKKQKLSFITHINKKVISFYAIVPKYFLNEFETVCENVWKGINIDVVEDLPFSFEDDYTVTALSTKESDSLSLRVDKRDNFLLSNVLSSSNVIKDSEELVTVYNFLPSSRPTVKSLKGKMKDDLEKYKQNYSITKNKSAVSVATNIAKISLRYTSDLISETVKEFGVDMKPASSQKEMFENQISEDTKNKPKKELVQTQLIVLSKAKGRERQKDINSYVADNFDCLEQDNKFVYKTKYMKDKKNLNSKSFDFFKYKYEAPVSVLSVSECQHFISLPGSGLMKEYKTIENIPYKQLDVPEVATQGYLTTGVANNRGVKKNIFFTNEDIEVATKGVYMLGPMGTGKSTYMKHYICDALLHEDLVVVFDYIGDNEFATDLERMLPKQYRHIIDLGDYKSKSASSIAFNELDVKHIKREAYKTQEDYEEAVCRAVGEYAEQVMFLMQSVNGNGVGAEFTNRMEKIIRGAALLTFYKEDQTLMSMYRVLTDHIYRHKCYDEMPSFLKKDCMIDIKEFLDTVDFSKVDIDPVTKKPKVDEFGEQKKIILGTQESSITFLLDRFNPFRSNRELKLLTEKDPKDNIDFAKLFYESKQKVIIIKVPDDVYQEKQKDIICNFYANKILLAMKLRKAKYKKDFPEDPKGKKMTLAHVMFDEVHLLNGTLNLIETWLTQFRKFRMKPFFTGHFLGQLPTKVADAIKAAGYNYIITGSLDEKSFNGVKEFFKEFDHEQCSNLINRQYMVSAYYTSGVRNFIVQAPPDVTVSGHPILAKKGKK